MYKGLEVDTLLEFEEKQEGQCDLYAVNTAERRAKK